MKHAALATLIVAAAPAAAQPTARDRGDLAVRARDVLRRHCGECHGDRPRRGDVSVLDHPKLTAPAYPIPLVKPADPPRSLVLELIRDGSMPPGGRPPLATAEVKLVTDWITAGAPGYPRTFGDAFAVEAAKTDWAARPDADKPFLRYLSFAHLLRDDATLPDLRIAEAGLRSALRSGASKDVPLTPADPAATVFRLDLRAAGWDRGDLFDRVEKGPPRADAHPLTAFDVLLLEYPFAAAAEGFGDAAKMAGVRKVPVVRADWLTAALAPSAPLTTDVRSLAELGPGKEPCGPRPGRFFAGPGVPGQPLEAWHARDPDEGAPFRFTAEVVTGESFDTPVLEVKAREKHKLRVTSDRPVRVRVLRVLADGDTRLQEIERESIPAGTTLLGTRTNVPFSAGAATGGGDAETDYFVVFAAVDDVPVPTILRSRHRLDCDEDRNRFPLSRFLFEPTDPRFDPARVIRRVVPLTVRRS